MAVPVDTHARAAMQAVDAALAAAGLVSRVLAPEHRGVEVEVEGWRLDIGIAATGQILLAQAEVVGPGQVDPHDLLHDHRRLAFARFSHSADGAVWVEGELPLVAAAAAPNLVDAMLGSVLLATENARRRATDRRRGGSTRVPSGRSGD